MSNKSLFDKLFNEVMEAGPDMEAQTDEDALELPQGDEGGDEMGSDESFGDEGGDITVSMSRSQAEALRDLLDAALGGGGEDEDEDFGEEETLDMGGEGEEGLGGGELGESPAVETLEELPTQKYVDALTGKKNKVEGALAAKDNAGSEGSGEVTQAHPLKKASLAYNDGKGKKHQVGGKYTQQNKTTSSYLNQ